MHNTSLLHAIVCSLSIVRYHIPCVQTLFVHLHTHTHTHQCFILNLPLWLLLFSAVAAAAAVRICYINSRGPDYEQMKTLDLSLNYMYLSFFVVVGHIALPSEYVCMCVCVCFALVFIWVVRFFFVHR